MALFFSFLVAQLFEITLLTQDCLSVAQANSHLYAYNIHAHHTHHCNRLVAQTTCFGEGKRVWSNGQ